MDEEAMVDILGQGRAGVLSFAAGATSAGREW